MIFGIKYSYYMFRAKITKSFAKALYWREKADRLSVFYLNKTTTAKEKAAIAKTIRKEEQ